MGAWLAGRSLARGLPAPVAEPGGWRLESGQPDERRRYLFPAPCPRLAALGVAIVEPLVAIKLCRPGAELIALLPPGWRLAHGTRMMVRGQAAAPAALPRGYALAMTRTGVVTTARVTDADGALAASGHAAEAGGAFVYDRIATVAAHRRRGLARAVMAALAGARRDSVSRDILTATDAGRALYRTIGWRDYCPYATAVRG